MADAPQNSFIPKRGPTKQIKRVVTKNVYLLTILSYVAFFSVLLASAGTFGYERFTTSQLNQALTNFNNETASFDEAAFQRLIQLESQLRQLQVALNSQLSFAAILGYLEQSTIASTRVTALELTRDTADVGGNQGAMPAASGGLVAVTASIGTDSLDSVIFQRDTYVAASDVLAVSVDGVQQVFSDPTSVPSRPLTNSNDDGAPEDPVRYDLVLMLNGENYPINPVAAATINPVFSNTPSPVEITEMVTETESDQP